MQTYMTPEEHARSHKRRRRQLLGFLMAVLMIVGVITVISAGVRAVSRLFDDTEEKLEYEAKLEGLVMFDPLPFEGLENIDDLTLRQAAVWGCIYSIQETQGNLDSYSRDPETEQLMLPAVDVDAYLARLVGPSFQLNHRSFETEDMTVEYDETSQCYLIPITSNVGYYQATVTELFKQDGKLYVTVGYIPQASQDDLIVTPSDTPTKYMDYIFERTDGNWYLTGLTESATKPEVTEPDASANSVVMMDEEELQAAILAGVDPNAASSEQTASSDENAEAEAAEEGSEAESDAESDAESASSEQADSESTAA